MRADPTRPLPGRTKELSRRSRRCAAPPASPRCTVASTPPPRWSASPGASSAPSISTSRCPRPLRRARAAALRLPLAGADRAAHGRRPRHLRAPGGRGSQELPARRRRRRVPRVDAGCRLRAAGLDRGRRSADAARTQRRGPPLALERDPRADRDPCAGAAGGSLHPLRCPDPPGPVRCSLPRPCRRPGPPPACARSTRCHWRSLLRWAGIACCVGAAQFPFGARGSSARLSRDLGEDHHVVVAVGLRALRTPGIREAQTRATCSRTGAVVHGEAPVAVAVHRGDGYSRTSMRSPARHMLSLGTRADTGEQRALHHVVADTEEELCCVHDRDDPDAPVEARADPHVQARPARRQVA
jgi:hypothetical protein